MFGMDSFLASSNPVLCMPGSGDLNWILCHCLQRLASALVDRSRPPHHRSPSKDLDSDLAEEQQVAFPEEQQVAEPMPLAPALLVVESPDAALPQQVKVVWLADANTWLSTSMKVLDQQ